MGVWIKEPLPLEPLSANIPAEYAEGFHIIQELKRRDPFWEEKSKYYDNKYYYQYSFLQVADFLKKEYAHLTCKLNFYY